MPVQDQGLKLAIVGATGAVGREIVKCLERRSFPVRDLKLLASTRSAGTTIDFKGRSLPVQELTHDALHALDVVLFAAGNRVSLEFAPTAVREGAVVIDNSSAFGWIPAFRWLHRKSTEQPSPRTRASSPTRTARRSFRSRRFGRFIRIPYPSSPGLHLSGRFGRGRRRDGGADGLYARILRRRYL